MIFILLSILFSSGLFVIFKYFGIYRIDTLKAIVVNYIVAFTVGLISSEKIFSVYEIVSKEWFLGAIILGAMFVSVFFLMAKTAQINGVSVASVAGKMSVVIPVFFGVFLYNETLTSIKFLGIIIALIAVYLTSSKEDLTNKKTANLLFPILLFFGSGAIDTLLKFIEINYVSENEVAIFSATLFCIAGFFGAIIIMFNSIKSKQSFGLKNIIAGIILGVPNYYSIIFLIKALQVDGFESSTLFTINNVGIVVCSTLLGLFIFKEKLSAKNKIGIFLALLGIILVSLT